MLPSCTLSCIAASGHPHEQCGCRVTALIGRPSPPQQQHACSGSRSRLTHSDASSITACSNPSFTLSTGPSWASSPLHAPSRRGSAGGRAGLGPHRAAPPRGRACAGAAADCPRGPHCAGSCAGSHPQPGRLPQAPQPPPGGCGARALRNRHLRCGRRALLQCWEHTAGAPRAGARVWGASW